MLTANEYQCADCPTIIRALRKRRGPSRCGPCRTSAVQRAAAERGRKQTPADRWKARIGWQYGLSVAEYERLLAIQSGRCAICLTEEPGGTQSVGRAVWSIDHDHETGRVRGLLCSACNRGIGLLGDDADTCRRAADYLAQAAPIGRVT